MINQNNLLQVLRLWNVKSKWKTFPLFSSRSITTFPEMMMASNSNEENNTKMDYNRFINEMSARRKPSLIREMSNCIYLSLRYSY